MGCDLSQLSENYDWRWQLRHAVTNEAEIEQHLSLTERERRAVQVFSQSRLPFRVTPHFLSLIDKNDTNCPLRRQLVPQVAELDPDANLRTDPLGEEDHEVVPHLVHRYPDRVLLLATDRCASYCRFCTRKRWVGQGPTPKPADLHRALEYIRAHPQIEEVIVSGGDALMFSDAHLQDMLTQIRSIPHVQIIRLATRMLTFAPMRVTEELLSVLKPLAPIYVMSHINHPKEVSPASEKAIRMLVDAGVVVLNQTVLLKGVNDNRATLCELFKLLVRHRVRPYYLHQCDVVEGSTHFRVPIQQAQALFASLRGHISGLCMPSFVIDVPGGFGKVPMELSPVVEEDEQNLWLRGFDGEIAPYPKS